MTKLTLESVTVSFEAVIYCDDCGEDIYVEAGKVKMESTEISCIRVKPCERCIKAAKEEGEFNERDEHFNG